MLHSSDLTHTCSKYNNVTKTYHKRSLKDVTPLNNKCKKDDGTIMSHLSGALNLSRHPYQDEKRCLKKKK